MSAILRDNGQLIAKGIGCCLERHHILRISAPAQTFFGTPHGSELRFEMRSKISEPQVQIRDPLINLSRTITDIPFNPNASSTMRRQVRAQERQLEMLEPDPVWTVRTQVGAGEARKCGMYSWREGWERYRTSSGRDE